MGGSNSVEFLVDQESPSGTGEMVLMTSPIDGVTPAQFWEGFEKFVRERKPRAKNFETELLLEDLPDGRGLRVGATIETSGIVAKVFPFKGVINLVYKFPVVDNRLVIAYHHLDAACKPESKAKEYVMKIHEEGSTFRIEGTGRQFEVRTYGPILQTLTETFLKDLGCQGVVAKADQASPSSSGELSVVTDVIPDPELTVQKAWEKYTAKLVADGTGQETEDPTKFVFDRASTLSFENAFCILQLNEQSNEICQYEYGGDETLQDLRFTVTHKFLPSADGPRLEVWGRGVDAPLQSHDVKSTVEDNVTSVLNKLQGKDE